MRSLGAAAQTIFDAIARAAAAGKACPTNVELADAIDAGSISSPAKMIMVLERRGLISVERFGAGRQVTIAATGQKTAYSGKRAPHWSTRGIKPQPRQPRPQPASEAAPAERTSIREQAFAEAELRERRFSAARKMTSAPVSDLPDIGDRAILSAPAQMNDDRPFALSRDPCPRCATRGDLGCAHQRPFEEPERAPSETSRSPRLPR